MEERTEQENIYKHLEFVFKSIDEYKEAMLKDKDDNAKVELDKSILKYFEDIANNTLIGIDKTKGGV